ncbi:MAG: helix-turn-helix transcriptional regulator [Devosia sp.]|nr:helix-turn-helix transcriptional regulator [Devosia sp.]
MAPTRRTDFRSAAEWIEKLPAKSRERAKTAAVQNIEAIRLAEVRKALTVTQTALAQRTGLKQGEVSRIENNPTSVQIKTLDRYVAGLGGRLRIVAEFPDGSRADIPLEQGRPVRSKATITSG